MASEGGSHASPSDEVRLVVVATKNAGKLEEIGASLDFAGWRFVAASDIDPEWEGAEETGATFEENARIKALAAHQAFCAAALADDSGLEVDALLGRPGVRSSRYAGEDASDADNNTKLLSELADAEKRSARFRCTIVFIDEDGSETLATGTCEGSIGQAGRGDGGFGYDPLFLPDATPGKTMAELTIAEKNAISHRGAALRELRRKLVQRG
jgi:XTP/dITP diphosphohydrolase